MSHITVAEIQIKNPNIQILKQALTILAQELNCQLIENATVLDYYGLSQKADFVLDIKLVGKARGIGFRIRNGQLELIADTWAMGCKNISPSEIMNKVVQYYTAIAVATVAQQLGFTVQNLQQTREAIIIDLAR